MQPTWWYSIAEHFPLEQPELVMNFTEKVTNNYGHQIFMAPILSNDI